MTFPCFQKKAIQTLTADFRLVDPLLKVEEPTLLAAAVKLRQVLDLVTLLVWLEELLQQADREEEEVVVLLILYLRAVQVELEAVLYLNRH